MKGTRRCNRYCPAFLTDLSGPTWKRNSLDQTRLPGHRPGGRDTCEGWLVSQIFTRQRHTGVPLARHLGLGSLPVVLTGVCATGAHRFQDRGYGPGAQQTVAPEGTAPRTRTSGGAADVRFPCVRPSCCATLSDQRRRETPPPGDPVRYPRRFRHLEDAAPGWLQLTSTLRRTSVQNVTRFATPAALPQGKGLVEAPGASTAW